MRSLIAIFALVALRAAALTVVDEYDLRARVRIPVVEGNSESLGRRVYRTQELRGRLRVAYRDPYSAPELEITGLENRNQSVGGVPVAYETDVSGVVWSAIGDNRRDRFRVASVRFAVVADPSYNIGDDGIDNVLSLVFAGRGPSGAASLSGQVAGTAGCGCAEYGHRSPTRRMFVPRISRRIPGAGEPWRYPVAIDVASCWGTWTAKFISRTEKKEDET